MITPEEIRKKAEKLYFPFLQSWLCEEPFFPRSFSAGSVPQSFPVFREAVQAICLQEKKRRGFGYEITYQTRRMKYCGVQEVPVKIVWSSATDFLSFLGKGEEFAQFKQTVLAIRHQFPQLEAWLCQHPKQILTYPDSTWHDLLLVCSYFLAHPRPGCSMREIPLQISTKFVEKHTGILDELLREVLPRDAINLEGKTFEERFGLERKDHHIHLRFLDEQLREDYHVPFVSFGLNRSDLSALDMCGHVCIIVENRKTFARLPALPDTIAIWGSGSMVQVLEDVAWLPTCTLMYWGDLDAQGFEILSRLRQAFPHVHSIMMNEETFSQFRHFAIRGKACAGTSLSSLTREEQELYFYLAETTTRLEQERLPLDFVQQQLRVYFQTICHSTLLDKSPAAITSSIALKRRFEDDGREYYYRKSV